MGLGIDTTRKFFKSNKYLDPIKEHILNTFSKSTLFKKLPKELQTRFKLMNIFALSSGRACGIAIIRMSGPDTLSICKLISKEKKIKENEINLCKFFDPSNDTIIDPEALMLWFPKPNSFTGDDLANSMFME